MDNSNPSKVISEGVSKGIISAYAWTVVPLCIAFYVVGYFSDRDSTDSEDERSGMTIHVDNLTGCHYLNKSSLTPRLTKGGVHYGCK